MKFGCGVYRMAYPGKSVHNVVRSMVGGVLARVHIASNPWKTLCGRPIPDNATEIAKPPSRQGQDLQGLP